MNGTCRQQAEVVPQLACPTNLPFLELTRCERVKAQILSKVWKETNLLLDFGTLRVTYSYKETQTRIVDNQMGDFERQWAIGSWSTISAHCTPSFWVNRGYP